MSVARITRIALGWLALSALQLGLWALLAPQSFYEGFPGFGRAWVAVDGPFNEHLIRDVGALNLALAALLIFAAWRLTRDLVIIAAVASLAWGVPHFLYHAANTDGLSTGDNVMSLGGLGLSIALAVLLLRSARHLELVDASDPVPGPTVGAGR